MASRRECDRLIQEGKVYVNNNRAKLGDMICYGDKVCVDGHDVNWESIMKLKMNNLTVISCVYGLIYNI